MGVALNLSGLSVRPLPYARGPRAAKGQRPEPCVLHPGLRLRFQVDVCKKDPCCVPGNRGRGGGNAARRWVLPPTPLLSPRPAVW